MEKQLGKITAVSFGICYDRPHLFGLELTFEGATGWGASSAATWLANMESHPEQVATNEKLVRISRFTHSLLRDAKVRTIDKLVGVPVEVTFDEHEMFVSCRILSEVL